MFDILKKKSVIVAAIVAAFMISLLLGIKNNGKNSKLIPSTVSQENLTDNDVSLLSYKKKPDNWSQRLKQDGSLPDFDLFTSPSVYKQDGKLLIKTYDMLIIDDALPLYLAGIQPKPYRLKIEGYSRSKSDDKVMIMFLDIETGKYCECSTNERCKDLEFYVRDFNLSGYEKNGVYYEIPVVKVFDEKIKKEIELTNEQKFLDGKYIVIIKDVNGNEYILRDIGDNIRIGEAVCTLRSFSEKDGMAKLLLKDANGQEFHKTVHLIR